MVFMRFIAQNSIKIVLTIKVMIVAYIVVDEFELIKFGEKPLAAQDNQPESKEANNKAEPEQPANDVAKNDEDEDEEEVIGQKSRRSFLDDLLTLPKIDTKVLKKEELGYHRSFIGNHRPPS